MNCKEHNTMLQQSAVHQKSLAKRAMSPMLVVLLLISSALVGVLLAVDQPAASNPADSGIDFVIPWTGYLEVDGQPYTGNRQVIMKVTDGAGGGGPVEFDRQTVNVQEGRFSMIVRPNAQQRDSIAQMRRPQMNLTVDGRELFGARPLRVASSAIQSGVAREPTFDEGISVDGTTNVSQTAAFSEQMNVTGSDGASVSGDFSAFEGEFEGDIRVHGSLASLGGLHLTNPSNSRIDTSSGNLRLRSSDDSTLLEASGSGIEFGSRLLIGRQDITDTTSSGNGALIAANGQLRFENDSMFLGNNTTLSTGEVHMPGGISFDGRINNLRSGYLTVSFLGRIYSFSATATAGNRRRTIGLLDADTHVCVLSGISVYHEHKEYSCEVFRSGGQWNVRADLADPRSDVEVTCYARCLYYGAM